MKTPDTHLQPSRAILVPVGETHVLIDPGAERLYVLNAAAAELWRRLEAGEGAFSRAGTLFLQEMHRLGVLPGPPPPPAEGGAGAGPHPRVLSIAPLQVAANTSDPNPFSADSSW